MPLPKPKAGQTRKDFLDSCMASDVMNSEYPDNKQRYAVCNSQWKKAKRKDNHMDLIGAEIFASGKWNGLEFSDEDLDEIVSNFENLADVHKIPLKLGHNDDQPMTDGKPALGWVSRVYRQGKKLLADFTDMPQVVYDAVKKKLYRTVSVELLNNVQHGDNKYKWVLDAVALLGADHPAVNTLEDLNTLLASRSNFSGGRRVAFETVAGNAKSINYGGNDMPEQDVKELIAEAIGPLKEELSTLRDQNKSLADENRQLKADKEKFEAERKDAEERARKDKIEFHRKEVKGVLDEAVRSEQILPAAREIFEKQIGIDSDDRVLEINLEDLKKMFSIKSPSKDGGANGGGATKYDHPDQELFRLANEHLVKTGKSGMAEFQRSLGVVAQANPELHRAYLDMHSEG